MGIRTFQILLTLSYTPPKVKQIPINFLNWPTQAKNLQNLLLHGTGLICNLQKCDVNTWHSSKFSYPHITTIWWVFKF
jgi:hypothetical protein